MAVILCLFTGCAEQKIDYPVLDDYDADYVTTQNSTYVSTTENTSASTTSVEPVEDSQTVSSTETVFSDSTPISITSFATFEESYVSEFPAPDTVEDINNEKFIKYERINSAFKPASSKKHAYLYNFSTSLSTGFGEEDIALPTEAFYGIKGNVDGRLLTISAYDHIGGKS